jgi:hypothetical protein
MVLSGWEDPMPRQILLDFRGEELRALWGRLPERSRREAIAIWMQLIASAARDPSTTHGDKKEHR